MKREMSSALIKPDNPRSYPDELIELIEENEFLRDNFREVFDELSLDSDSYLKKVDNFYKKLLNADSDGVAKLCETLLEQIGEYWVEGFHLSRVMDRDVYLKKGIEVLNPDSYCARMAAVFQKLGVDEIKQKIFGGKLREYLQNFGEGRIGRISLFYPASNYILERYGCEGYVRLYAETIGGEVAKQAFSDGTYREMLELLQSAGEAVITRFRFQLKDLYLGETEFPYDYSIAQLIYAYLYNKKEGELPANYLFLAQLKRSVPPENVISTENVSTAYGRGILKEY